MAECGSSHKGHKDTSRRLHLNEDKKLGAEEKGLWILEGKTLMDGVARAGKGQRGQGRRQSGDGVEHGGGHSGFCSAAKGSLWGAVM